MRRGLLGGVSGTEEAGAFCAADFSGTASGVVGEGNPCVIDSEERESAGVHAVDENVRVAVEIRGRGKDVYYSVNGEQENEEMPSYLARPTSLYGQAYAPWSGHCASQCNWNNLYKCKK